MRNGEIEQSPERGGGGKDMLNGVGGLRVRWSLVVQPDEFIKGLWKKEEKKETVRKWRADARTEETFQPHR